MDDDFYVRFENRFRGSRDLIKKRLGIYLPIIDPLKVAYPEMLVIDIGCGRGEWLELLRENGWHVFGIDLNRSMLEQCRALGLPVEEGDAGQYLKNLGDNSVACITGFHIAEHLDFDVLVELVRQAHRVLIPGGVIILETPNPENIFVGACDFYTDPTHRNPLPPHLMEFLAEDSGFTKYRTIRLNGPQAADESPSHNNQLSQLLLSHPDYALIAQKNPDERGQPLFSLFEKLEAQHSKDLRSLHERLTELDRALNLEWERLEAALHDKEAERQRLEAALHDKEAERQRLETDIRVKDGERQRLEVALRDKEVRRQRLEAVLRAKDGERQRLEVALRDEEVERQRLEAVLRDKEARRQELEVTLDVVFRSRSWRITKPARWLSERTRRAREAVSGVRRAGTSTVRRAVRDLLRRVSAFVLAKPRLRNWALRMLSRFPGLKSRLKTLVSTSPAVYYPGMIESDVSQIPENLSPRAKQIWRDLMKAREQQLVHKEQARQAGGGA